MAAMGMTNALQQRPGSQTGEREDPAYQVSHYPDLAFHSQVYHSPADLHDLYRPAEDAPDNQIPGVEQWQCSKQRRHCMGLGGNIMLKTLYPPGIHQARSIKTLQNYAIAAF